MLPARSSRLAALPVWMPGKGQPPGGRFVALVPGEDAPLIPVNLPAGLKGSARLAVARRQVQDRIGSAAARLDLRPAALGAGADGWTALLATEPADLARWRAELGPAARRAQTLIPDYLALPAAPDLWVLAAGDGPDGPRLRARLGPVDGFAAEAGLAALMLARARARGPAPRAVLVAEGPLPPVIAEVLAGLLIVDSPDKLPAALRPPRAMALGEAALDLRRDPRQQALVLAARLRALVLPGVLALAGAAGWAGSVALETARLREQAAALDSATLDAVQRDILPGAPILDIRLQVAREIEQRQASAQAPASASGLDLIERAARGLVMAGAVPQSLTLTAPGRAEVELALPDFAALDRTVTTLREAALTVEVARRGTIGGGQVGAGLTLGLAPTAAQGNQP